MREIDIPEGKATLREKEDLRGRDSNLIAAAAMRASGAMGKMPTVGEKAKDETDAAYNARISEAMEGIIFSMDESLAMVELNNAAIVASIASWSLPRPLPKITDVDELPNELYQALVTAVGGEVLQMLARTEFKETDPKDGLETPTGASLPSSGTSPVATQTGSSNESSEIVPPTLTLSNVIESTPTESSTT